MPRPALSLQPEYRNKLEESIAAQLTIAGIEFAYEGEKIPYTVPGREAKYLPDFRTKNIIIEGKGWFGKGAKERQKLLLVRESNPALDIRLVFSDANKKIYKGSPTTYGDWADAHGFKWSTKGEVPKEWLKDMKPRLSGAMKGKRCRSSK